MCGRYRLKDPKAAFDWLEVQPGFNFKPRFNIAPTQRIPVVTGAHQVEQMTWGIVPVWAKDSSKALINARSETVRTKRSFKSAVEKRRCLIPGDGFYEWTKIGMKPHIFTVNSDAPFAIAGFWDPSEESNRCCLLTTSANAILEPIHNRMPVIVRREDWDEWFSPDLLPDDRFQRLTSPYAADEMSAVQVSSIVNSARIDDPRCSEPFDPGQIQEPTKLVIKRRSNDADGDQPTFGF